MIPISVHPRSAILHGSPHPSPLLWHRPGRLFSLGIGVILVVSLWFHLPHSPAVKSPLAGSHMYSHPIIATPIGLLQTSACDTFYLHNQTQPVGNHGPRRIADTTAPTAASPSVINNTLPLLSANDVEIARFYSDPVQPITYPVVGDLIGSLWLQTTDFNNTTFTVDLFDYNPANGNLGSLGSIEFIIITDGQNEVELVITPPNGATVAAGHRLLLILYARSPALTSPTVTLFYDGSDRASHLTFCHPKPPQLIISKTGPVTALAGRPITYTLTVANEGDLAATNLLISDTVPDGATYLSGGNKTGNTVSWLVDSLAAHASTQRSFAVTANTTVTNDQYQVTADGNFSAMGVEAVVTYVSAPGQPLLLISKSGPPSVKSGGPITYILTVTNGGDTTLSGIQITDTLPAGATYVSGGTRNGNAVTWNIATPLGPQASLQRSFVVTAKQTITNDDYQATAAPDVVAVGQKVVTTQVTPPQLYLPLTMKTGAENLQTTLVIESINTEGINLVRVLRADNNQELLTCTGIGNNVTVTCGKFNAVGTYKIIAETNRCGSLQGTFDDATPGATVTRQIFCN